MPVWTRYFLFFFLLGSWDLSCTILLSRPRGFSDYVLHLPLSVSGVTDTESDRLRGITNNKVDTDPWGTADKGGDEREGRRRRGGASFDSYVSRASFVPSSTIHPSLPPTLTPPKQYTCLLRWAWQLALLREERKNLLRAIGANARTSTKVGGQPRSDHPVFVRARSCPPRTHRIVLPIRGRRQRWARRPKAGFWL